MTERVQKIMAGAGVASRRASEELIREGRVTVNGEVVELGDQADPEADEIRVDGQLLGEAEPHRYLILNKPRGVLSSLASQGGHPTVLDMVETEVRLYPVGRLDLESEGLLVMTNDGELAHRLTHPSFEHEKEYRVRVSRPPSRAELQAWRRGPVVPGMGKLAPAEVLAEPGQPRWIRITLREGKKRQIRETAAHFGLRVERLIRVRMATIRLDELPEGRWRELEREEVRRLKAATGLAREGA